MWRYWNGFIVIGHSFSAAISIDSAVVSYKSLLVFTGGLTKLKSESSEFRAGTPSFRPEPKLALVSHSHFLNHCAVQYGKFFWKYGS